LILVELVTRDGRLALSVRKMGAYKADKMGDNPIREAWDDQWEDKD